MKKEEKREEIRRILPLLWNSYQHMYDVRVKNIATQINFLLIVVSFLLTFSFSLFEYFNDYIFFLSIFFQVIALFTLIQVFFMKMPDVHWFEIEPTLESIQNKKFDENLFGDLKLLEGDTWSYLKKMERIRLISVCSILISLFITIFIFVLSYPSSLINSILILFLFLLLVIFYIKDQPNYKYRDNLENHLYRKKTANWLKDGKVA